MHHIRIADADFSPADELTPLEALGAGGIATFLGLVRRGSPPIAALTLEHYPGMTERALTAIATEAGRRFPILGCVITHRIGRMTPGTRIVLAAAAAAHRGPALDATAFLIDWLKTEAPFWKKETFEDGREEWVAARTTDGVARARWL